jgi:hypothetical protein
MSEDRADHVANAFQLCAAANHYLVIVDTKGFTLEELEGAEQLLIERQNELEDEDENYEVLERALNMIEDRIATVTRA